MRIDLLQAIDCLESGQVIAIPTETVYGLAASIHHPVAVEEIYRLKNRPKSNPLTVQVASVEEIHLFTKNFPPRFLEFAKRYWPGSLTMVIPVDEGTTKAFRIPDHPATLALLEAVGPLLVPSANLSGEPPALSEEEVESTFGGEFPVLSGGVCKEGIASTIIAWNGVEWEYLREGAISPLS